MFLVLHLRVLGVFDVAPTRSSEDSRPDSVTFMLLGAIMEPVISGILRSIGEVKGDADCLPLYICPHCQVYPGRLARGEGAWSPVSTATLRLYMLRVFPLID